MRNGVDVWNTGIVFALDAQLPAGLGFDQGGHPLGDFVDVDRRQLSRLRGAEQAIHQLPQPFGFGDDDIGVFPQVVAGQFLGQQLGGAQDAAQRVLDLVRQAADQVARGVVRGQQSAFPADPQTAVHGQHFNQEQRFRFALNG